MPLYEYECKRCAHRFEALVRAGNVPSCPLCQSQDLERLLSMFAVDSDQTRKAALDSGRKHAAREQRDKAVADHEYRKHHQHCRERTPR